jgi:mannosyltransferase OCH1-like enzyme
MQHQDWEWVLWSDADNLKLVQKYYPWLEESYRALPEEIYRADLVRTLYMYTFGGYVA